MKSLRKIAIWSGISLLAAPAAYLAARPRAARPPSQAAAAPPPATPANQQAARPEDASLNDAQARITVNSRLVVLPVTVKDRDGEMIPDLERGDFRVFEDNVEQNIDVFSAEAFPLSIVCLLYTSPSPRDS